MIDMPKSRKRKTKSRVQAIPVQVKAVIGKNTKTGEPILAVYKTKSFKHVKHKN
jgi:hypothetical protein